MLLPLCNNQKFGLIIGAGDLAQSVLKALDAQEVYCVIFDHMPQTHWIKQTHHTWFECKMGHIGSALDFFKKHGVTELVFAGHMKRPNFLTLSLDSKGKELLTYMGKSIFKGDDTLLKMLISFLTLEGFHVHSTIDILNVQQDHYQTHLQPLPDQWDDIHFGARLLQALSPFDVGQAVVIEKGLILGIEAIEGTQDLMRRVAPLQNAQKSSILIKISKTNQTLLADVPTIGRQTVLDAHAHGFCGIALEKNKTQMIDPQAVIEEADRYGLFIVFIDLPPHVS